MVKQGKVKPTDKRTVPNLHEIDGKWVIKYKKTLDSLLDRVRARWTLRGDKQRPYFDYLPHEIHSPVATKTTVLTDLVIACQSNLELYAIDIGKAFTISDLEDELKERGVFVRVPDHFRVEHDKHRHKHGMNAPDVHADITPYGEHTTWELLTSLYGLRQASSRYYHKFSGDVLSYEDSKGQKYRRNHHDPCSFTKGKYVPGVNSDGSTKCEDFITFCCHVDDKFVAASSRAQVDELVHMLKQKGYDVKLEPMELALGIGIEYVRYDPGTPGSGTITLNHNTYIKDAYNEACKHPLISASQTSPLNVPMSDGEYKLNPEQHEPEFNRERYKLFRSILGKVQHCSLYTHPEISTAVSIVSSRMQNPSARDLKRCFNILRYLYGTTQHNDNRAMFVIRRDNRYDNPQFKQHPIHCLCDADLGNCPHTRRSRTGYALFLYSNLVGWSSKRQTSVSLSTCESEYVALSEVCKCALWYKRLVADIGLEFAHYEPVVVLTDSLSAKNLAAAQVSVLSKYTKHIQHRISWFKECLRGPNRSIRLLHVPGTQNVSDIMTKCLPHKAFTTYRKKLLHGDRRSFRGVCNKLHAHMVHVPYETLKHVHTETYLCSLKYTNVPTRPSAYNIDPAICNCHNPYTFACLTVDTHPHLLA